MDITRMDISTITSKTLKERVYLTSLPEYYELSSAIENNHWHNNQNVLDHVIAVFAGLETILKFENINPAQADRIKKYLSIVASSKTRKEILVVATLLHDIAKTDTLVKHSDGTTNCPGHELIAAGRVSGFSERFDLNQEDESRVGRIVTYHGFVSEILDLMIANGNKEKYFSIFTETVGDISIDLILLMQADLLGSDLERSNKKGFEDRINLLVWMLEKQLREMDWK